MNHRRLFCCLVAIAAVVVACGSSSQDSNHDDVSTGGATGTGGATSLGGALGTGGKIGVGGQDTGGMTSQQMDPSMTLKATLVVDMSYSGTGMLLGCTGLAIVQYTSNSANTQPTITDDSSKLTKVDCTDWSMTSVQKADWPTACTTNNWTSCLLCFEYDYPMNGTCVGYSVEVTAKTTDAKGTETATLTIEFPNAP